jgi:hypothetical protein
MHPALAADLFQPFKFGERIGVVVDAQIVEGIVLAVVDQQARLGLQPIPVQDKSLGYALGHLQSTQQTIESSMFSQLFPNLFRIQGDAWTKVHDVEKSQITAR